MPPRFDRPAVIFIICLAFVLINSNLFAQDEEIEKLLKLNIEELTDLKVVSATKLLSKISEVPATVKVITAETIKQNGYLNLEDALSGLPGFQFRNILGFNNYIFQRGIPNQNNLTLMLIDGLAINELNSGGFYAGGQFNLNDIEQIEVIYGPASALYGTNAISGVINIITKNPANDQGLHLSGLAGAFKTYSGNLSYSYFDEQNRAGFRLSAMIKSSDKADLGGSAGDNNWYANMENFEDDYSLNLKAMYNDFELGIIYQNKRSSRTTNYKSVGTEYLDKGTLWNIGFLNSFLKHNYVFSENLGIQTTLAYRNSTVYDNTIAYITDNFQVGYFRPSHLFSGESIVSYSAFQDLKIIGGILFESESLSDDYSVTYSNSRQTKPPTPPAPMMDKNNLFSAYLQVQSRIWDYINLFAGARYDNSTNYGQVITPRLALVFNKNEFTMKFLYSEAFRAPKPWDYTFGMGNPDLEPEKMKSGEIQAGYYFSDALHASLSVYKNKLADEIRQETGTSGYRWINKGDVKTEGIEAGIDYQKGSIKSYVNFTYNYSIDDSGAQLPEISKHTANAGIILSLPSDILIALRCNYIGKRNNPKIISAIAGTVVDAAFIFNSSVSYSGFENFILNLTIVNLFNEVYYHTSNRPPDRYRQPQRTVLFKIDYSF